MTENSALWKNRAKMNLKIDNMEYMEYGFEMEYSTNRQKSKKDKIFSDFVIFHFSKETPNMESVPISSLKGLNLQ